MRRPLSLTAGALYLLLNVFVWVALAPPPALACSCVLVTIGDMNKPENQVFVGTAGAFGPGGQPVTVERWFHGTGIAPIVVLARDSFGQDGDACRIAPLSVGTRWILATWRAVPGAEPRIDACQPHASLDTPEGQAMLGEAQAAFGAGVTPPLGPPTDTKPSSADPLAPALVVGTAAFGVAVLAGVLLVARRRS